MSSRNRRLQEQKRKKDMTDRPGTQPTPGHDHDCCPPGYQKCDITMSGYMCCPEPCPPKMCNKMKHLPCAVEGEQVMGAIQVFLTANPGYVVSQVLDHGHDGWTVVIVGPC